VNFHDLFIKIKPTAREGLMHKYLHNLQISKNITASF